VKVTNQEIILGFKGITKSTSKHLQQVLKSKSNEDLLRNLLNDG
jgi:hypothetical protein